MVTDHLIALSNQSFSTLWMLPLTVYFLSTSHSFNRYLSDTNYVRSTVLGASCTKTYIFVLWILQLFYFYCSSFPDSSVGKESTCNAGEVKWSEVNVAQSCPTFCDPTDYTVHGVLQARILEWVAFPFSRGSSQPRDRTQVSQIAGGFFTSWATREAQESWSCSLSFPGHLLIKIFVLYT